MALLAKSKDSKNNIAERTLKEHINDCLLILEYLKKGFPAAARVSGFNENYWDLLKQSILFHDLGKAHKEFQKLLHGKENKWNSQRHELFSIPFINAITNKNEDQIYLLKLVVAGHHKDFEKLQKYLNFYGASGSFGMLETLNEDETESFVNAFDKHVNVTEVLALLKEFNITLNEIKDKKIEGFIIKYNRNPIKVNNSAWLSLILLFGGLKWCDHLGSAMVTKLYKLEEQDFCFLKNQHKDLLINGYDFYAHQKECATVYGNLILTAPTGSGKTESAFLWLQNQIKNNGQGRVFYILPFTASINAMYERLNTAIGGNKVGMLHGKLSDYLNNYFDDLQYDAQAKKDNIESIKEKFRSIITPVKVVTPFQLLKHLFGLKGYEQGIFEMAGAYLIFDEIHAYSPEVFAQIKVLLEFATSYLQTKIMIMTATMPRFILNELKECIDPYKSVLANETLYNDFKRHKIVLKEGLLEESLEEIRKQLNDGKKVLVVCNSVKTSQNVFRILKEYVGHEEALLLHGSFTGEDRSIKEKHLMTKETKLLVGTQAIEVSLDIDYDMIFTEPAPIDALIQRFGRVNRKRKKGICNCYVFIQHNETDKFIYNPDIVKNTIKELKKIETKNEGIIDEAAMQTVIDEVYQEWNEEDKEKFDMQYHYLKEALQLLSPMLKNKYTEEDFYNQFDGIKILPQNRKDSYEERLQAFDFISAEGLKVQISKRKFAAWLNPQRKNIKNAISVFAKKNKMEEQRYFITNKRYTPELGLIADEEDPWVTTEIL